MLHFPTRKRPTKNLKTEPNNRKRRGFKMNLGPRTLIVYGTSFGATKGTSEEIAKILREENFNVRIVDANEEKVKDIAE